MYDKCNCSHNSSLFNKALCKKRLKANIQLEQLVILIAIKLENTNNKACNDDSFAKSLSLQGDRGDPGPPGMPVSTVRGFSACVLS